MRLYLVTVGGVTLRMRGLAHKGGDIMETLFLALLLALIAIGVFATVWELELIRQILDKRP